MSQIPDATCKNDEAHFTFLTTTRGFVAEPSQTSGLTDAERWGIKYLYDRLNILDNKTSSMLRFNGVAIGFLAVLSLGLVENKNINLWPTSKVYLVGGLLAIGLFCWAEYFAFRIFQLRFDRIAETSTFEKYKKNFFSITCNRERQYRCMWLLSALGGALFVILVGVIVFFSLIGWD